MNELLSPVSVLDRASAGKGLSLASRPALTKKVLSNTSLNKLSEDDRSFHDWYRFVLSFPPHLVREYLLNRFSLPAGSTVLDPFCGTGTTVVEARMNGFATVGIEANAIAHFAGRTKSDWTADPDILAITAERIAQRGTKCAAAEKQIRLRNLDGEREKLLISNSICPLPLHKSLILKEMIISETEPGTVRDHLCLALAKTLVFSASNLHFGPEVGVRGRKDDAPVFEEWLENVQMMATDLKNVSGRSALPAEVILADARDMSGHLSERSIDAVFTSPPYPNEKDYTRTTRLESVLLGFINSKDDLRAIKRNLLRSNTRGIYTNFKESKATN